MCISSLIDRTGLDGPILHSLLPSLLIVWFWGCWFLSQSLHTLLYISPIRLEDRRKKQKNTICKRKRTNSEGPKLHPAKTQAAPPNPVHEGYEQNRWQMAVLLESNPHRNQISQLKAVVEELTSWSPSPCPQSTCRLVGQTTLIPPGLLWTHPPFPVLKEGAHHPCLPLQRHWSRCPYDVAEVCQPTLLSPNWKTCQWCI